MSSVFDVYQLPEGHQAIREAVRAVCDGKVAPRVPGTRADHGAAAGTREGQDP